MGPDVHEVETLQGLGVEGVRPGTDPDAVQRLPIKPCDLYVPELHIDTLKVRNDHAGVEMVNLKLIYSGQPDQRER